MFCSTEYQIKGLEHVFWSLPLCHISSSPLLVRERDSLSFHVVLELFIFLPQSLESWGYRHHQIGLEWRVSVCMV